MSIKVHFGKCSVLKTPNQTSKIIPGNHPANHPEPKKREAQNWQIKNPS